MVSSYYSTGIKGLSHSLGLKYVSRSLVKRERILTFHAPVRSTAGSSSSILDPFHYIESNSAFSLRYKFMQTATLIFNNPQGHIVSVKTYSKQGQERLDYDSLSPFYYDKGRFARQFDSGSLYEIELGIKVGIGQVKKVTMEYDLRGDVFNKNGIWVGLFGKTALALKGSSLLDLALDRMKQLNTLLPRERRIKRLNILMSLVDRGNPSSTSHECIVLPMLTFPFTMPRTPEEKRLSVEGCITHEFGHIIDDALPSSDQHPFFVDIFYEVKANQKVMSLFIDDDYERTEKMGHPWDNHEELFASIFNIATLHLKKLEKRIYDGSLTEEERALAIKAVNMVYRKAYGKDAIV